METHPLDTISAPASIGFVGASSNPANMGTMQLLNLLYSGYRGKVWPVHPREKEIYGLPAYPRIADLPEAPAMFMLVVPTRLIPEMVAEFARLGTRRGVIVSAGFKETGESGAALEARLAELAQREDIRFLGPNCMGLVDTRCPLNLTAAPFRGGRGGLSLISQSGTYIVQTLEYLRARGIALNKAYSVGNETTIDLVDCLEYLGRDPDTRAIGMYIECIRRPRRFLEVARCIDKPMVAQYVGGTVAGARSGASHTGALAGPDHVYDGLLVQAGVIRLDSIEAVYQVGHTLAGQPPPRGPRIAVLTNSGGPGTAMASRLDAGGMAVPELSEALQARLRGHLPGYASVRNPVDLTFHTDMTQIADTLPRILMEADEIDGLLIHGIMDTGWAEMVFPMFQKFFGAGLEDIRKMLNVDIGTLVGLPAAYGKPLLICSFFGREDHALRTFHEHGIPTFDGPEKAAAAMTFLWRWAQIRQKKRPAAVTAPVPEAVAQSVAALGRAVDEFDAKQILAACGVLTVRESRVETVDEAVAAARRIGFPVAVKGCSAAVLHKTEAHLVHLGLSGDDAVAAAARAVQARMPGIRLLVSEMLDSRREVIAGVSRPAGFPPCVLLGLGGVMAEALEDRVVRLAPLDEEDALEMMDALRGRRVLDAWRGMPAVDRGALADLLVRLGRLADAFPRLQEIDLNPILFVDGRPKVADALFVV
jgi:acetyltransferase